MSGFNSKRQMAADKLQEPYDQTALELCNVCGWKTLIPDDGCLNCERAQPAQEPVGTLNISRYKGHLVNHDFDYFGELPDGTYSVYTTPPKRTWVGLTVQERNS